MSTFTAAELKIAYDRFNKGKVSGSDNMPVEIMKEAFREYP